MQVILLEKVRNLGNLGDQVNVKSGYARNFLLPQAKAVMANEANKAKFEARRAELEKKQAESMAAAQARAAKMEGATVRISAKASDEGKLFGSVSNIDIAEALSKLGFELNRSEVQMPNGPIKNIGDHEVFAALHPEITVKIVVSVVGEA
jgi:large subunit ribosomal protein L9